MRIFSFFLLVWATQTFCLLDAQDLGIFQGSSDVGQVSRVGHVSYDPNGQYLVTASGANVWGPRDAFHFVWKKVSGDIIATAVVTLSEGGNPHRKAGLMIRKSLEPDSPYADAVLHGDGLISLQYRLEKGGPTAEIQAPFHGPYQLRLERAGSLFSLYLTGEGDLQHSLGSVLVDVGSSPYVGLMATAHDPSGIMEAKFTDVSIESKSASPEVKRVIESSLEVIEIESGRRSIVYRARDHFEAPNWSPDDQYFVFNSNGLLYRLDVMGGSPARIDTGQLRQCNNDHGFSPDGRLLAISDNSTGHSLIYVLPAEGGRPRLVTEQGPSYWHGWSPDGKTLAYCAERDGNYDVYTIPVEGGPEKRLTRAEGLDDGPDYSPDGDYIYLNSIRSGLMKIWRISPDGETQEQITFDEEFADWFPHPSPDGKWIVFLSYDKSVEGHPANQEVVLRLMPAEGGQPRVLARLFGGQGTINVPSWSPDSRRFAFVSYRLVLPD